MKKPKKIAKLGAPLVRRLLAVIKPGLSDGLGEPKPGKMCVEAAVCYAYGWPHDDNPKCVAEAIRQFKISLNDRHWSSFKARAEGMKRLAVAQLGSKRISDARFNRALLGEAIRAVTALMITVAPKELGTGYDVSPKGLRLRRINSQYRAYRDALDHLLAAYAKPVLSSYQYATVTDALRHLPGLKGKNSDLRLMAEVGLNALIALKSEGTRYLYLVK